MDESDETDCPLHCSPCSKEGMFKCHKRCQCIPINYVCDASPDCDDRSDEIGCPKVSTPSPTPTPTPRSLCDNNQAYRQCVFNCERKCHSLLIECKERRECKPGCTCENGLVSNGTFCVLPTECICYDEVLKVYKEAGETWQRNCQTCACFNDSITCTPKICPELYCPAPRMLVQKPGKCCKECVIVTPAPPTRPPEKKCLMSEFKCDANNCIPKEWVCDGERDCFNAEDERFCKTTPKTCADALGKSFFLNARYTVF